MQSFKFISAAALLLVSTVHASSEGVSYKYMGKDWSGTCKNGTQQSPIDIPTNFSSVFNTSKIYSRFLD